MCTPPREWRGRAVGTGRPARARYSGGLDAGDCALFLVDHQEGLLGTVDCDRPDRLVDNVVALGAAAGVGGIPAVCTTLAYTGGCGPLLLRLHAVLPDRVEVQRTVIDPWRDRTVVAAVGGAGRPTLVVAGLWTEVCVTRPVLAALWAGFGVAVVTDACAGTCIEAHESAIDLMTRAGAVPVTTAEVLDAWTPRLLALPA